MTERADDVAFVVLFGSMARGNILLYDALTDGSCLWDSGPWQSYRDRFANLVAEGLIQRIPHGWRWTEEAEARLASEPVIPHP